MSYIKWILVASNLPILIAAIYTICIYKKLESTLKLFSWFIYLTAAIQIPYLILWFKRKNNLPLLHIYVLLSFIILTMFYRKVLRNFINRRIITGLGILFSCVTIINSAFIQGIWTFNSNALTVMSLIVVILSLATFVLLLNNEIKENDKELSGSIRWINSGLFIYYASSLLLFYFGSDFMKQFSLTFNRYAWLLNSFFLTVMYICFIIGIWKRQKISAS